MSAKELFFIDTNIFVYAVGTEETKGQIAQEVIRYALASGDGIISAQVMQEFFNVATKKLKPAMTPDEIVEYTVTALRPLCKVNTGPNLLLRALRIHQKEKISFYDALIVAAALHAGCRKLLSEDLQDSRFIETVQIINPFNHL